MRAEGDPGKKLREESWADYSVPFKGPGLNVNPSIPNPSSHINVYHGHAVLTPQATV